MQTLRHLRLYFLIVIFGLIDLAVAADKVITKEATNSAVPVDEEQIGEETVALTAPQKAETEPIKKIPEAPKERVSSTEKTTTKDPVNRLFYAGHQFLWFVERLWERLKYNVNRALYRFRIQRHYYSQYPAYGPGHYAQGPYGR